MKNLFLILFTALTFGAFAQTPVGGSYVGCLKNTGTTVIDCWDCWSCDDDPRGNNRCYGQCDYNCGTCFLAEETTTEDIYRISYNPQGEIVEVIDNVTGWTVTEQSENGHTFLRYELY